MSLYHIQEAPIYEYLYRSANLSEAHWLYGTLVDFYPCLSYARDVSNDPHPVWSHPEKINIYFEENPKAKLRKLNWLADDENLPFLAYISNIIYPKFRQFKKQYNNDYKSIKAQFEKAFNEDGTPSETNSFYIPVRRYSKVVVPYKMEVSGEQKLIVTEITGDSTNPFIWTCKLVPYHEQVDMRPVIQVEKTKDTVYTPSNKTPEEQQQFINSPSITEYEKNLPPESLQAAIGAPVTITRNSDVVTNTVVDLGAFDDPDTKLPAKKLKGTLRVERYIQDNNKAPVTGHSFLKNFKY